MLNISNKISTLISKEVILAWEFFMSIRAQTFEASLHLVKLTELRFYKTARYCTGTGHLST